MSLTRREGLLAIASVFAGGIVATVSNFSIQNARQSQFAAPNFPDIDLQARGTGWILSEEDMAALTRLDDATIDEARFETFDRVDYYGGDVASFRAVNSADCAAACDADSDCTRFTYATKAHEVTGKRRMCWLKDDTIEGTRRDAGAYLSGQKR